MIQRANSNSHDSNNNMSNSNSNMSDADNTLPLTTTTSNTVSSINNNNKRNNNNNNSPQPSHQHRNRSTRRGDRNNNAHNSDDDDVSEVTTDTTLRESHRHPVEHNWAEQMALLKLDLANTKAECDRAQWQHGQLLEKKQLADRTIGVLEQENKELKVSLRAVEKKYLILSMHGTTASSSPQHQNHNSDNNSDAYSSTDRSIHSHSVKPYRTIHEDDEEDDVDDVDDCTSTGWRNNRDDDTHDGGGGSVRHNTTRSHHNSSMTSLSTPFVDMTSMTLGDNYSSSGSGLHAHHHHSALGDSMKDISMNDDAGPKAAGDDTRTLNTATSTKYADDDPFATMNPRDDDDDESVDAAASWWGGWGNATKTKK
mmetsp:Transcript_16954/g.28147  ORF Transcript_16954/g.28147 Transcript_16954/m.28147 type:complete len:368 (-) Transcript_16954:97-1200(-)